MNPRARRIRKHNRRNYKCEVPELSKDIIRALNHPTGLNDQSYRLSPNNLWVNRLIKLGFEIFKTYHRDILINKEKGLVVKIMFSLSAPPINRVPTLFIKNIYKSSTSSTDIVVQKIADTSDNAKLKAMQEVGEVLTLDSSKCIKKFGYDIKSDNVGLYKNKVVAIDW
jgi:hypothetical protein